MQKWFLKGFRSNTPQIFFFNINHDDLRENIAVNKTDLLTIYGKGFPVSYNQNYELFCADVQINFSLTSFLGKQLGEKSGSP